MLAVIVAPQVLGKLGGAKVNAAKIQMENIGSALDTFLLDTGKYPTTQQGLRVLIDNSDRIRGWNGPYLDTKFIPMDPWGSAYVYRSPGERSHYDLVTLGSDQSPGGEGEAADFAENRR